MTVRELDVVVLTRALPEHGPQEGDVGAVVHAYSGGAGYEVEFVTGAGKTLAVATLEPGDVRPLGDGEILHVRHVAA
jgi:hypothetical protein